MALAPGNLVRKCCPNAECGVAPSGPVVPANRRPEHGTAR